LKSQIYRTTLNRIEASHHMSPGQSQFRHGFVRTFMRCVEASVLLIPFLCATPSSTRATGSSACSLEQNVSAASSEGDSERARCPDVNSLMQGPLRIERVSLEDVAGEDESQPAETSNVNAADHSAKAMKSSADCAVCFAGELRHLLAVRGNLHTRLLKPIVADGVDIDVFVAAPSGGPYGVDDFGLGSLDLGASPEDTSLLSVVYQMNKIEGITLRDVRLRPEPSAKELEETLKKWASPEALKFYEKNSQAGSNWLAPVFGPKGGGRALHTYRHGAECKEMILAQEDRRNSLYEWLIVTRPDFEWLAPHPPLSLQGLGV